MSTVAAIIAAGMSEWSAGEWSAFFAAAATFVGALAAAIVMAVANIRKAMSRSDAATDTANVAAEQVADVKARQDRHSARVQQIEAAVRQLALHVPSPPAATPSQRPAGLVGANVVTPRDEPKP